MSDLMEEIKEDVTIERLLTFLKKYRKLLLIVLVGVTCAGSGYGVWSYFHEKYRHERASAFEMALERAQEGQTTEALRLFDALRKKDPKEGYALLAVFRELALMAEGSPEQTALYKKVILHSQIEPKFRELAVILWGYESLEALSSDDLDLLEKELDKIAKGRGPWIKSAQELLALMDLHRGSVQSGLHRLSVLAQDQEAPSALRERAFAVIEQLGKMR